MLIDLLIAAGAALLAAVAGLPVTSGVLRLAAREDGAGENDLGELEGEDSTAVSTEDSTEESAEPNVPDPTPTASTGVMRGGLMIGVLERALAAAAVALGRGEVLAVIIAVKGLGPHSRTEEFAGRGGAVHHWHLRVAGRGVRCWGGRILADPGCVK